jgi:hypothetical protein
VACFQRPSPAPLAGASGCCGCRDQGAMCNPSSLAIEPAPNGVGQLFRRRRSSGSAAGGSGEAMHTHFGEAQCGACARYSRGACRSRRLKTNPVLAKRTQSCCSWLRISRPYDIRLSDEYLIRTADRLSWQEMRNEANGDFGFFGGGEVRDRDERWNSAQPARGGPRRIALPGRTGVWSLPRRDGHLRWVHCSRVLMPRAIRLAGRWS